MKNFHDEVMTRSFKIRASCKTPDDGKNDDFESVYQSRSDQSPAPENILG